MLAHSNIDRQDAKEVSKAPFTYTSTLEMAGNMLPPGSILSLRVYVDENAVMPFRIHSILPDGRVSFCDNSGAIQAYWQTYPTTVTGNDIVSSLLYDENGIIYGHISCKSTVIDIVRLVINGITDPYVLPADAFVLLPQCHVAMLQGVGRSIGLISQGNRLTNSTNDITLAVVDDQVVNATEAYGGQFSILESSESINTRAPLNGICHVTVTAGTDSTTYDTYDRSIIIKSALLSNLRVVKEDGSIVLRGVLNA